MMPGKECQQDKNESLIFFKKKLWLLLTLTHLPSKIRKFWKHMVWNGDSEFDLRATKKAVLIYTLDYIILPPTIGVRITPLYKNLFNHAVQLRNVVSRVCLKVLMI